MILSWIRYLAFLLPTALLYLLFGGYLFFLLLALLLMLPLLSFIGMRVHLKRTGLYFEQRKQKLYLRCKGEGFFPLVSVRAKLLMENCFSKEQNERTLWFYRGQNDSFAMEDIETQMGLCTLQIMDCMCYDMLGLFRTTLPMQMKKSFLVYPSFVPSILTQQKAYQEAQEEMLSLQQSGFLEDKHEVREYRPGDSLHRIHHKLSYKLSKTMIREFGAEEETSFTLFLDLSKTLDDCVLVLSAMREAFLQLCVEGKPVVICWNSETQLQEALVSDEKSFWQCMDRILSAPKAQSALLPAVFERYRYAWLIDASGMHRLKKRRDTV